MKWLQPSEEQQEKLRNAEWMYERIVALIGMVAAKKVTLGDETYLFSRRADRFDRLISMCSWLEFPDFPVVGMKWVSSRSANLKQGLPRGGAVSVLNDGETGMPLLAYEGSDISLARTAMVACVGINILANAPRTAALIGAGRVHDWQATYMRQLWPGVELFVFDLDENRKKEFAEKFQARSMLQWKEALNCDVVSLATAGTGSTGWISHKEGFQPRGLWVNISLRDIQPRLISKFDLVVVDDHSYAASQGTPYDFAWRAGWVKKEVSLENLFDADMLDIAKRKPVLLNPMGLPLWDVGIGYYLFHEELVYWRGRLLREVSTAAVATG